MSEECSQCGEKLKDPNLKFCTACGAEIRPLEVEFAPEIDESASGFQKMLVSMQSSYYSIIFNLNSAFADKTSNLFNKRMFLSKNVSILQRFPLEDRTLRLSSTRDRIQAVSHSIRAENQLLGQKFADAQAAFDSGEFVSSKVRLADIFGHAKKLGLYQWVHDIKQLQAQIAANLQALHQLQRINIAEGEPLEALKPPLDYRYFHLTRLQQSAQNRAADPQNLLQYHPTVADQIAREVEKYSHLYQSAGRGPPTFGFGGKFKIFFLSQSENISYFMVHSKFNRLLKEGQDESDLPKAWESLQEAKKIIEDDATKIYRDKVEEYELMLEQTRDKIARLNQEKDAIFEKALESLQNFEFDQATQMLDEFIATLQKYSMAVLIGQVESMKQRGAFNAQTVGSIAQIMAVYAAGDYLEAQSQVDALVASTAEGVAEFGLVEAVREQLLSLQGQVTRSRTEGESIQLGEIDEIWRELEEELTFASAHTQLTQKREICEKQAYKDALKKLDIMFKNFELNRESFDYLSAIEKLFDAAKYAEAEAKLKELDKRVSKAKKNHFAALIAKIEDFGQKLEAQIHDEGQEITGIIADARKLLVEKLEFFRATELLDQAQQRAEAAGLGDLGKQIETFGKEIAENQRILTEQLGYEKTIKSGLLMEAKAGLEGLHSIVKKHEKAYYPLILNNLEDLLKKLEGQVQAEEDAIAAEIAKFHDEMDESTDFSGPRMILEELQKRIELNGFAQFSETLQAMGQKLEANIQKRAELEAVQKIFEEGDINVAERKAKDLLGDITKTLSKAPRFYCEALKTSVELLNSEIQTALKDGHDKLSADFAAIQEKSKSALDFTEILQKLKNYQIRAQRLGEEDLKNEIVVLTSQVQYNANLILRHNALAQKYQRMEDFLQTLRDIKALVSSVEGDAAVFDQIKQAVIALKDRVDDDSSNREERLRISLQAVIADELNQLDFAKAAESLRGLKETAQSLGITTFNSEINKFALICQSHKNFKIRANSALAKYTSGDVMAARELCNDVIVDLDHHDGPVLDAMRTFVTENYEKFDKEIKGEIAEITEDVKGRLFRLIEAKKGEAAYWVLEEKLGRAKYLEDDGLVSEIEDLMKLCTLQFDPTAKKYRKRRGKIDLEAIEEEIQDTDATAFVQQPEIDETRADESRRASIQTMLVKYDPQAQEKTPEFETRAELRKYKKEQRIKRKARVIKPPKVQDNLNNEVRNSVTRTRLQAFDRQANRPIKRANSSTCLNCGYTQHGDQNIFCEFCGRPL